MSNFFPKLTRCFVLPLFFVSFLLQSNAKPVLADCGNSECEPPEEEIA